MEKMLTLSLILVSLIVISISIILFLHSQIDQETDGTVSAQVFSESIQTDINESSKKIYLNFKSFDDGDQVTIKDNIYMINYWQDEDYTSIEFDVNTTLDTGEHVTSLEFDIKGNITSTYNKNDLVTITFTIKQVKFNYQDWYYDLEVYKEGYDQQYYLNNYFTQILPQSSIKKL